MPGVKIPSDREYLYGLNPAFEMLRAGRRKIHRVFLNKTAASNPRLKKLCALLGRENIPLEWTNKEQLFGFCGTREHQGVVLEGDPYPYVGLDVLFGGTKLLLLDNVEDPQNVGAILRSAEIFGFHSLLLPLKGVPSIYPSVVKASAGATEFLHIAKEASANRYVRRARAEGFQVVALDPRGKTALGDLEISRREKLLLAVGGEDRSVGHFILQFADAVVRIEQKGVINSLNAAAAAAIAMYELAMPPARQGRAGGTRNRRM